MENKCKKCGTDLQKDDYVFMGYCEKCYSEETNKDPKTTKIIGKLKSIMGMLLIIGIIAIIIVACSSGSGTSKKSNSKYDFKTKSDGTRTWYEKDNPHIVDLDKHK